MEQHKYTIMILILGFVSVSRAAHSLEPNHAAFQTAVRLLNVHEFAFNGARSAVQLAVSSAILNKNNYAVFVNGQLMMNASPTTDSVVVRGDFDAASILTLFTLHSINSFHLYFGNITASIRVFYSNGSAANNVTVNLNLMENPRVGQMHSTDHRGIVVFQNVPSLPTFISAQTKQHHATLVGIIPSTSQINLILMPLKDDMKLVKVRGPTCDQCQKNCTSCSSDPMCRQTCRNPPMQSCAFYSECMEAKVSCGIDGYALGYGMKYCTKFSHSLKTFTPRGQRWIWKTMNCLQKSLISPLETCANNCSALRKIAFASHPACYVKSGVCELTAFDWIRIVSIVGKDLFTSDGFAQALKTLPQCLPNLLERISLLILEDSLPESMRISLIVLATWLRSL